VEKKTAISRTQLFLGLDTVERFRRILPAGSHVDISSDHPENRPSDKLEEESNRLKTLATSFAFDYLKTLNERKNGSPGTRQTRTRKKRRQRREEKTASTSSHLQAPSGAPQATHQAEGDVEMSDVEVDKPQRLLEIREYSYFFLFSFSEQIDH